MPIPKFDKAVIEPAKLRDYLLSTEHPVGRLKAVFFARLGYAKERWPQLEGDLREQILPLPVTRTVPSHYGIKFVVEGELQCPNGRTAHIVSVWVILNREEIPRFVTAYPRG